MRNTERKVQRLGSGQVHAGHLLAQSRLVAAAAEVQMSAASPAITKSRSEAIIGIGRKVSPDGHTLARCC